MTYPHFINLHHTAPATPDSHPTTSSSYLPIKPLLFLIMTEVQLIIRFPESLAEIVNKALARSKDSIDIKLNPEDTSNKPNTQMTEPNKASVKFGDRTFPALIARLPCNIETHKTFDHVHYYKAGDIAEMIQVFESEDEREFARYEMGQVEGYRRTFLSGITPPTAQIIRRKFMKTRSKKTKPKEVVSQVEDEIQKYTSSADIIEEFEEVVDFEEYMADADNPHGRVFCFDSAALTTGDSLELLQHPEMLLQSSDKQMLAALKEKERKRSSSSAAAGTSSSAEEDHHDEAEESSSNGAGGDDDGGGGGGGDADEEEDEEQQEDEEDEEDGEGMGKEGDGGEDQGSGSGSGSGDDTDSDDEAFLNDLEAGLQTNE